MTAVDVAENRWCAATKWLRYNVQNRTLMKMSRIGYSRIAATLNVIQHLANGVVVYGRSIVRLSIEVENEPRGSIVDELERINCRRWESN